MAIRKDLTAKRFFHLVVLRQSDSRRDSGSVKIRTVWRCLCDRRAADRAQVTVVERLGLVKPTSAEMVLA